MLAELGSGAEPTRQTMKLHVIARALELRARRPQPFGAAGAYRALEAGPDVCAFTRGDDEVLVAVALRRPAAGALLDIAAGRYRDVLSGREHDLAAPLPAGQIVESSGMALLERI
jgi:maltooligosyltrehalose synthase